MAQKNSVFKSFINEQADFKSNFLNLLKSFFGDFSLSLKDLKLMNNFKIGDLENFIKKFSLDSLKDSFKSELLKNLDEFKKLYDQSLTALYGSALGFLTNLSQSLIDALISQIYIPEDVFLTIIKGLQQNGSDPNYNGELRKVCLQHDLYKTIEWLDDYNKVTYDYTNRKLANDGIVAANYGSFNVARYFIDRFYKEKKKFETVPFDSNNEKEVANRKEILQTYTYTIHVIAKHAIMGSYSNIDLKQINNLCKDYNIVPSAFGSNDRILGGRSLINKNDIDRAAPIYSGGSIKIIQQRFKRLFKTTYITPRNYNIKYIYLYLSDKSIWGNNAMYNKPFYERMKSVVISTLLKNLSDASASVLTTGLGKYIVDPQETIDKLIYLAAKKLSPYLFDPKKQIYINLADTASIPELSESGYFTKNQLLKDEITTTSTSSNPNNPSAVEMSDAENIIKEFNGLDLRKFKVYRYEDINNASNISTLEFKIRVVDVLFRTLKGGKYKTYTIQTELFRKKVYDISTISVSTIDFNGTYENSSVDFYILSTLDDINISVDAKKFIIMKYLYELYGPNKIPYLSELYPELNFNKFLDIISKYNPSYKVSIGNQNNMNVTFDVDFEQFNEDDNQLTYLFELYERYKADPTILTSEELEELLKKIQEVQTRIKNNLEKLASKLETIDQPRGWRLSLEAWELFKMLRRISSYKNNNYLNMNESNLSNYSNKINNILKKAQLKEAVEVLGAITTTENSITNGSVTADELSNLSSTLKNLIDSNNIQKLEADTISRLEALINNIQNIINDMIRNNISTTDLQTALQSIIIYNDAITKQESSIIIEDSNSNVLLKDQIQASNSLIIRDTNDVLSGFQQRFEVLYA